MSQLDKIEYKLREPTLDYSNLEFPILGVLVAGLLSYLGEYNNARIIVYVTFFGYFFVFVFGLFWEAYLSKKLNDEFSERLVGDKK